MTNVHLLVLVHGMWGNPNHLSELARTACETYTEPSPDGTNLHVLMAQTIKEESTYDGIDWGGERVASEVLETVKDLEANGKKVVRFSITGYSLGGLISRYCIGVLDQQGFFKDKEPVNFNTIATPHCGLPRYLSLFSTLASKLGPRLLSRTGEQFYCADKWSSNGGRPLLVVMADPSQLFYLALKKFRHIRIYANAINDITVPYVTAAIELQDPFADSDKNGIEIDLSNEYPCLITNYSIPDVPPPPVPKPRKLSVEWFRNLPAPMLPPVLRFRFPLNLVVYALLPVLIPALLTLVISRFALATHASRSRIKVLEKEANGSEKKLLVHLLDEIEREMEGAVADLIDDPDPIPMYLTEQSRAHPVISPDHRKIAAWLNTLPIKKELTYFQKVVNSHAMIVCRDIHHFEFHRLGEPVLRHWVSHFAI